MSLRLFRTASERASSKLDRRAQSHANLPKPKLVEGAVAGSIQIVWFKRDLRTQDHAPLADAIAATKAAQAAPQTKLHGPLTPSGGVLCLYIHEPSSAAAPEMSRRHSVFLRECLDDLRSALNALGGDLLEVVGESVDVFERLRGHFGGAIDTLWAHQETTSGRDFERDQAVKRWARQHGIGVREAAQNGVVRGRARSAQTPHGHAFEHHVKLACQAPAATLTPMECSGAWVKITFPSAALGAIPQAMGEDSPGRIRGGRTVALKRLEVFTGFERLASYPRLISSPIEAEDGCSRLSPHLSFGTLSDREAIRAANDAAHAASQSLPPAKAEWVQKASAFFAQRLYWRSGYLQMLESHPELEFGGDVHALVGLREASFEPKRDAERLARWETGHTGFPMIDASMRMLREVGWINMRMRGMLASFAVNELWLPPREVGLHLARQFLDLEPAIHWGQIAIHAGLLSSSRPLIYNPIKQAQDQDPDGTFVRRWVPELANIPVEHIIEPWRMPEAEQVRAACRMGVDYPMPIVDFKGASKCAKDRVYALREGKPDPRGLPFECVHDTFIDPSTASTRSSTQNEPETERNKRAQGSTSQLSLF